MSDESDRKRRLIGVFMYLFKNAPGPDCKQTVICRFISTFAVTIVKPHVPHKNLSFEKFHLNTEYSRLSLSRSRRDPLKHFEISVLRNIRIAEFRKNSIEQPNFTNEHVI